MRPTDQAVAALLLRASWQVQGVGFQLHANDREQMALEMRELANRLAPVVSHPNGPTPPSPRLHGAYTGD